MLKAIFELTAEKRTTVGKGASRRLRVQEKVPAIIYGADQEPMLITLEHRHLSKALENEAFYSHILTLHVDGKAEQTVLKDLQRHPFKRQIVHADFLRVSAKDKLHMQIPLHFQGEDDAPGLEKGGIITHHLIQLDIKCLPADLPEFIAVDVSKLDVGDAIHLSEIQLPKGVELAAGAVDHAHDQPIASMHLPRAMKEEEEISAESEEATAEPDASAETDEGAE
jgi:large subunit ribosomal protein L25